MKAKASLLALLLLAAASTSIFFGCGQHEDPYLFDSINWDGDSDGTLELVNGSAHKDFILFIGKIPSASSIVGGVRAGASKRYDISRHVDDFAVGGWSILRGVTKDEWDKNPDPTKAKIEFTAMVTYRAGAVYRYNIDANFMGDYGFRVTNNSEVGIELRKNSPDGEKVAYLPRLQRDQWVYASSTEMITLFPVFVIYNNATKEVTTITAADMRASVGVVPEPVTSNETPNISFPDKGLSWDEIVKGIKSPVAYVKFTNNVMQQACYFTNAGSIRYISQDGYNAINGGKTLTFEVKGEDRNDEGELAITARRQLLVQTRGVDIPVLEDGNTPLIENGYNYEATIEFTGGDVLDASNYKAIIIKGSKRKIELGSLT